MNIIDKFGNIVGTEAMKDPEKARRLLLTGYRMQEKKLQLFPDRALPESGQYVAKIVMKNIIEALAKPEQAAMVSILSRASSWRQQALPRTRWRHCPALSPERNVSRHF